MANFYLLQTDVRPELPPDYIWVKQEDINGYAVPRLVELLFESMEKKALL